MPPPLPFFFRGALYPKSKLVSANDRTPGTRYLYDARSNTLHALAEINPKVAASDMAPMVQRLLDSSTAAGVPTGIDLPQLLALRQRVVDWLPGEQTHGALWRAGLPKIFK